MISDARGGHVSPGVYTEERDIALSVSSLGITSLGLAGETLKGPAFEAIEVKSWSDFTNYFGGTSTEKFKGSGLPKYELAYIAKSYLEESKDLTVCRVLGLSGYETSSAMTVYATIGSTEKGTATTYPLSVLRSKADYKGAEDPTGCSKGTYEKFRAFVTSFEVKPYSGSTFSSTCQVISSDGVVHKLDGYIVNGGAYDMVQYDTPSAGTIEGYLHVDSADTMEYCSAITQAISPIYFLPGEEINKFAIELKYIVPGYLSGCAKETINISLNSADKDYMYNVLSIDPLVGTHKVFIESLFDYSLNTLLADAKNEGKKFQLAGKTLGDPEFTNFKEPFRCAETPWVVSEVDAGSESIDMKRLFKFYTISDGNASNYQVKISIQNIRIDEGLFDVVVRDFYDEDTAPVILEKYSNCSLRVGESSYIGLKIGTFDGEYELKSKYITVRINDEVEMEDSIPCGFLGYPVPKYGQKNHPVLAYNTMLNNEVKTKRQYFGLTKNILDEDILNYKGVHAYADGTGDFDPDILTNGFHLDSILSEEVLGDEESTLYGLPVCVEGVSGFTFTAVSPNQSYKGGLVEEKIPRIVTETYAEDTIYEDKAARKFTMYMYGGFDGWDIYRTERTNTDAYKATKYNTSIPGNPFDGDENMYKDLNSTLDLHLPANAISSDYYAYLGAYEQFANPEGVDINLFATPGIDWYNNTLLVEDAIDIIEDVEDGRGGDALYIMTTPQTSDGSEIWDTQDLVDNLADKEVISSYACTYYPWVKVYDSSDKVFINLPVTKDVVRNMAQTDNNSYPWFSPAGMSRGQVDCVKAVFKTTLQDEDILYGGTINPVKTFAKDGVIVWGNKTMYTKESPLNRVNVRRLMLRIKKLVVNASKVLIFEQYDETLEKQFRSVIEPILSSVKTNRGLYDYKIITECTAETRDQHILPAKILVKPTPSLEYISISFVVYPESVEFNDDL